MEGENVGHCDPQEKKLVKLKLLGKMSLESCL